MSKTIVVTGSSSGLGLALATELVKANEYMVYGIDLKDPQITHPSYQHLICDLSSWGDAQKRIPEFLGPRTPLHVLINCAGVMPSSLVSALDPERALNAFAINTVVPMYLSKLLLKNLSRSREGHIINITSIAADVLIPGEVVYSATKAALKNISESMASEFSRFNVRVNSIAPALVHTAMTDHLSQSQIDFMQTKQAILESATPKHVADSIITLICSPKQINSSTIYIGGIRK